ncbi:RDD family protein [Prauserella alba]|uniref:RDD domain-containing protein n=1 Tax=Prauserella alba TaxID=176898 RepID=A0ABN1V9Z7_9PSEU|nr:RDD family protein [Prauserella alba]MCP2179672.1 RDD family protein [Prauserella alba]
MTDHYPPHPITRPGASPAGGGPDRPEIITPGAWIRFPGAGPFVLATMASRFVARLVDAAILVIPAGAGFAGLLSAVVAHQPRLWWTLLLIAPATLIVWFGYEGLLVGLRGATVGKTVAGVRVVTARSATPRSGGPGVGVGMTRAAMLALPGLVPCLGWFITALVSVSPFFDEFARQGWQDKAAGTFVVSTKPVHY